MANWLFDAYIGYVEHKKLAKLQLFFDMHKRARIFIIKCVSFS